MTAANPCTDDLDWCPGPNADDNDELPCSSCFIEGARND